MEKQRTTGPWLCPWVVGMENWIPGRVLDDCSRPLWLPALRRCDRALREPRNEFAYTSLGRKSTVGRTNEAECRNARFVSIAKKPRNIRLSFLRANCARTWK